MIFAVLSISTNPRPLKRLTSTDSNYTLYRLHPYSARLVEIDLNDEFKIEGNVSHLNLSQLMGLADLTDLAITSMFLRTTGFNPVKGETRTLQRPC